MQHDVERPLQFAISLYAEEDARRRALDERSKNLLSLTTLYSGFVVLVLKEHPEHTMLERVLIVASIIALSSAFAFAVRGAAIRRFRRPFVTSTLVSDFDDSALSDHDMLARRMAGYMVAYDQNCAVNEGKARRIAVAEYLVLTGIALHAASAIIML